MMTNEEGARLLGEIMFKYHTQYGINEQTICSCLDKAFGWNNSYEVLLKIREEKKNIIVADRHNIIKNEIQDFNQL